MTPIEVLPLRDSRERRIFLNFPWKIFAGDPLWVPPFLPDMADRIDPKKGVWFQHGEAECFIAWRNGEPAGTITAARDFQADAERGMRECVFGFFHFIEDYAVMEALLDHTREWARGRGLETITGPFNLDYEDGYGILVEGRDRPPALLCGHTPAYYFDFIERYGFQPARGDNIAFALDIAEETPPLRELAAAAKKIRARKGFTFRSADMRRWREELDRIHILLNKALAHLPDFRSWPKEVVYRSLEPFRAIADPELILFAEDQGQTVGWLPGLPNLNEAFIHADGLRRPWDYLKLAWYMRKQPACMTIKSVLVLPEYWGSGVVFPMLDELIRRARKKGYRWIDLSLTSTDNPTTPALAARGGAKIYKRYRVYRRAA